MAGKIRKRKCRFCQDLFLPDYRNVKRQKYCRKPMCRKASKAASQKAWLSKPENVHQFKGPQEVERVRKWRQNNPGYSRGTKRKKALQDSLKVKTTEEQANVKQFVAGALQDSCVAQNPVLLGLIAHLSGYALQDDIAPIVLSMQQLGSDILYPPIPTGGRHEGKEKTHRSTHPPNPPDF